MTISQQQRTHDETSRPTGVKNVQVVRAIFGKQRGHQWISDSLTNTVAHRKNKHAPEQAEESRVPCSVGI